MIKIMLWVLAILIAITTIESTNGMDWKKMLHEDLDGCIVTSTEYHNAFAKVAMTCNYYDGMITGTIKETLYLSPRGYIIKAGW